ncbi:MAG: hypothetical protein ACJ74H_04730 [Thermoanaerobaculia bacterium]
MKARAIVVGGAVLLAAMVAMVLVRYGVEESGWRAVIRATARTSAFCVALAFARVKTREMLILLPVSHAVHYGAIIAVAILTTPSNAHISMTSLGGLAIFALMIDNAVRPKTAGVWLLWIIFVIAFAVRDMSIPIYPAVLGMLLIAGVVRAAPAFHGS